MRLEIKGLTKEYKRGKSTFKAVNNVDLSIASGDFVSIIGRSGSGKSTFLNLISSLIVPTAGSIKMDGDDVLAMKEEEASYYRNAKIGLIPQGYSSLSNLTVLDNVRLPFYLFKRKGDSSEKAIKLLEQVGIAYLSHSYPRELSGGELRRVSIARALMNDPAIVIADEPTSDLDSETTADIMELLRGISQKGTAILMVTHELDTISYGNLTYVMEAGVLTRREAE
jgi:ABC-type antimicrobial peptide transport system, ATPase component